MGLTITNVRKRDARQRCFKDCEYGDVFDWHGDVYMKTNAECNAVNLQTGRLAILWHTDVVIVLDAELIVKGADK